MSDLPTSRIIIAGGRDFSDYQQLYRYGECIVAAALYETEFISGACPNGADRYGEHFADDCCKQPKLFPADWDTYGRSAGFIRNKEMAEYCALGREGFLLAFWDGASTGTKSMIDLGFDFALNVVVVRYDR